MFTCNVQDANRKGTGQQGMSKVAASKREGTDRRRAAARVAQVGKGSVATWIALYAPATKLIHYYCGHAALYIHTEQYHVT